jgi:DNA-binding IclR family transcriptional regulator
VASAVLDHSGHPVAGVAVTYPVHEVAEDDRGRLATQVGAAAGELSRRIRGRNTAG